MSQDRSYVEANARELERLRALIGRLSEDDLRREAGGGWTVADVLGHIVFWDARVLALGQKLRRGEAFSDSDDEPEDPYWVNAAAHPLIAAIPPLDVAALVLRVAEETDALVESLPPERVWPNDDASPINALRASHRGEHVDQIERVLEDHGGGAG